MEASDEDEVVKMKFFITVFLRKYEQIRRTFYTFLKHLKVKAVCK